MTFIGCKNNKMKDYSVVYSSKDIDYSSPDYIKYQFDKLDKKIDKEISSKNDHYTWMDDVINDCTNGTILFEPKYTGNLFLISKLKLTKHFGGYKVEGVISNTSPFDISNIKIASAIMLISIKDSVKSIRSSSKIYAEKLNSGTANAFSIDVSIIDKSRLTSISDVKNLPQENSVDSDSSSSILDELKIKDEYYNLGISIEEYVIHYKTFGSPSEVIDKNYLSDTIYNYNTSFSEIVYGVSDFRNEDDFENINPLGQYEFDGIGKIESKYSKIKGEEKWKALHDLMVARAKGVQSFGNNPATKDDVGNPTTSQTTVKPPEKTDLNASYERLKARNKSYAANIGKKFVDARNPALAHGNFEFDQYVTNVDRFKNSPCYDKLGFNPVKALKDSIGLEQEYQACENEYRIKRNTKMFIYFFTAFMLFIITMVLFKKYYKKRIH